jgi:hypothetical protein
MATRFTSYDLYKRMLADKDGNVNTKATFLCKLNILGSGSASALRRDHQRLPYSHKWSLTTYSWSLCWCYRSRPRCYTHGSHQDPITSTTPLDGRPSRHTKVPKRCARPIYRRKGRRRRNPMAWCLAHGIATGHKSGCKFHRVFRAESAAPEIPWHERPTQLRDVTHWIDVWCCWTVHECTHRYDQDAIAKTTG